MLACMSMLVLPVGAVAVEAVDEVRAHAVGAGR